eukprot:4424672-Pyramimonas_sp.AAC.1
MSALFESLAGFSGPLMVIFWAVVDGRTSRQATASKNGRNHKKVNGVCFIGLACRSFWKYSRPSWGARGPYSGRRRSPLSRQWLSWAVSVFVRRFWKPSCRSSWPSGGRHTRQRGKNRGGCLTK